MPVATPTPYKLLCTGLDLNHPVDAMPPGKFPILNNVQSLRVGEIDNRGGSTIVNATPVPSSIHSVRRMNDQVLGIYTRLIGAGPSLYGGTNTFPLLDTGYSGSPLSLVPFRPSQSISPWMYIGDSQRMRKVKADGTNYLMGIQPPLTAPTVGIADPFLNLIADFGTGAPFVASGTAGAITNPVRFATTISTIVYDQGTTSWATIAPVAAMNANYQIGALVTVGGVEQVPIHAVFPAITTTTASGILYDVGSTGACSVTLAGPSSGLIQNALVQIGADVVQVQSVIMGRDGVPSFRTSTPSNHTAGAAVTGFNSFRVFLAFTYAAGSTLGGNITAVPITAGIGILTRVTSENLGTIGGTQPTSPDDIIHASILFDVPGNVTQGWLEIDTSDGTFTGNYYSYNFSANLLAPALSGTSTVTTAQQVTIQQGIINQAASFSDPNNQDFSGQSPRFDNNSPGIDTNDTTGFITVPTGTSPTQSLSLGGSQWTELFFPVKSLIPIGTSQINSLATVAAIRVRVQVTGTVNLYASSWWIGGGFGPSVGAVGSPAIYVYRYKDSRTGALSNPSPYTLNGLQPNRERIIVDVAGSADPQVNQIDVFRFGIGLDQWTLVGSIPNAAGTQRFFDVYDALSLRGNEIADFDNFVPFPVSDIPRSGVCNVSGISVQYVSGDIFNTEWVAGSQFIVNGVPYALYGSPSSTLSLLLDGSAGAHTNVKWYMPEPTIAGNPLPRMWGYGGQGIGTYMFGVGDANSPGFLRWTKGNNPDTASDKGNLEITSPSEPLINGFEFDSRNFVFSSERLFAILPDLSGSLGSNGFTAQVVMTGKGLYAPYSICVMPTGIAWVGVDGVYIWAGGQPQSITDADLYPLFPHGSTQGKVTNGYFPPDYSLPDSMRLAYSSSSLYFTYIDTNGGHNILRYDFRLNGWFPESYPAPSTLVYTEEGKGVDSTLLVSSTGFLSQIAIGNSDDGAPIQCHFRTPAMDQGKSRAGKLYTDFMLDADPQASTMALTLHYNNSIITKPGGSVTGNGRSQSPLSTAPNQATFYLNVALDVAWSGPGTVYEFQPWYTVQPHLALQYFAAPVNFGNFAHVRDGWVGYISTADLQFTIIVDNINYTYRIPSSGGVYQRLYLVFGPLKGLLLGFSCTSTNAFYLFAGDTIVRLKPWGIDGAYSEYHPFQGMIEA